MGLFTVSNAFRVSVFPVSYAKRAQNGDVPDPLQHTPSDRRSPGHRKATALASLLRPPPTPDNKEPLCAAPSRPLR